MELLIAKALLEHSEERKVYFLSRNWSIEGEQGKSSASGGDYVTYIKGFEFDILNDSLSSLLDNLDSAVNRVINTSRELKLMECNSGGEYSTVHWCQFPEYTCEDGVVKVCFRFICHAIKTPTEDFV